MCITDRKEFLESYCATLERIEGATDLTHASTTVPSHPKVTRTESFATKKGCTDRWIGQWRDFWRVKKDEGTLHP
jgi:hypothetical protein